MVIRQLDNGTTMDLDIKTWRETIRTECTTKAQKIGITTTTDELAVYVTSPEYSSWSTVGIAST
jgi:hypothetical protein